jgi:hypothetical protein
VRQEEGRNRADEQMAIVADGDELSSLPDLLKFGMNPYKDLARFSAKIAHAKRRLM